jgi:hypothetical protein
MGIITKKGGDSVSICLKCLYNDECVVVREFCSYCKNFKDITEQADEEEYRLIIENEGRCHGRSY